MQLVSFDNWSSDVDWDIIAFWLDPHGAPFDHMFIISLKENVKCYKPVITTFEDSERGWSEVQGLPEQSEFKASLANFS